MGIFGKTMEKISGQVADLLVEMYPNLDKVIRFHEEENFNEWFALLWDLHKWNLDPISIYTDHISVVKSKVKKIANTIDNYEGLEDLGYFTLVMTDENEYHLLDGYHRLALAKRRDIKFIDKAVYWHKGQNSHPNCLKITRLIRENL
jgi:hypothetical protein